MTTATESKMLTREQVKSLLVLRCIEASKSDNQLHINHVVGATRALIAVLTGERPPRGLTADIREVFRMTGIPIEENADGTFGWPEDWLISHGFVVDGDDIRHPDFEDW